MLSSFYQSILEKIIDKIEINKKELEEILEYVENKDINTYIYPEVIQDRFNIESKHILELLILLEKRSVVKQVYKLFCPKCRDFSDEIFESINELEEQEVCDKCGEVLIGGEQPYKYVVVYFKKIKHE